MEVRRSLELDLAEADEGEVDAGVAWAEDSEIEGREGDDEEEEEEEAAIERRRRGTDGTLASGHG